ncbi:conserved hypothetical protein, membrane [Candidatus Magnetomorum sp. HK-1]|nr:conserved hypothetical protein, membrane [Candidatus Magnetomorum sp. HK-1]
MLDLLSLQATSSHPTVVMSIYTVVLSFILSVMIAFTYEKTFRGLSYSRNYVQALVLSPIVAATVMQAIGDSLASGLGMMGALAIIRFRTSLKDPKDIIFMFAALASGISCGVNGYSIALVGTIGFCLVAFFLYFTPFGQMSSFDGMLRCNLLNDQESIINFETILKTYCKIFALVTLREMSQGKRIDYAYQIKLKRGKEKNELVKDLSQVNSIENISLMLQETTIEL